MSDKKKVGRDRFKGTGAVILAAGCGSRLHPITEDRPKCLVELGGKTLIEWQLRALQSLGITDIVIVTGYRAEMLAPLGIRQVHNARWKTTNMVESLFTAEAEFGDDLIVSYADIVYEPRVLRALLQSRHEVSVVVDRDWRAYWESRFDDPLSDAETLRMDGRGRIIDIGDRPATIDEIEAQYIGLMRFKGDGVATLKRVHETFGRTRRPWMEKRTPTTAYMTDLLMEMILTGHDVHAVVVHGGWLEIDTVDDYERTTAMIEDGTISRVFTGEEPSIP